MSSSTALIASNLPAVNSSADFVAIVQLVGRSNAATDMLGSEIGLQLLPIA
jgi:hypothetical protein